jgi:hypothetical protein
VQVLQRKHLLPLPMLALRRSGRKREGVFAMLARGESRLSKICGAIQEMGDCHGTRHRCGFWPEHDGTHRCGCCGFEWSDKA